MRTRREVHPLATGRKRGHEAPFDHTLDDALDYTRAVANPARTADGGGASKLVGLGALYLAQGVPLGIAAEYLPVALRQSHASYSLIAAVSWLQLPWALKVLWARAGDAPRLRARARSVVFALQASLAGTIALYALQPLSQARALWFVLTAVAALLAATQDVFVDGLAVRTLAAGERGLGNVAQVGAYRLGMVAGGAGLLSLGDRVGERQAILGLAGLVLVASLGTTLVGERADEGTAPSPLAAPAGTSSSLRGELSAAWAALRAMLRPEVRAVLLVAFGYKLGLHAAGALLKPVLVDGGWSKERIGALAVTVGTLAGVAGSVAGGLLHRKLGDRRALTVAAVLQAAACAPLPLLVGHTSADSVPAVTAALAAEHAASGVGTTVLFSALMGATNREHAALEFTVLSTANAVSLAVAGGIAGVLADALGPRVVFVLAAALALGSLPLLPRWEGAARALRGDGGGEG